MTPFKKKRPGPIAAGGRGRRPSIRPSAALALAAAVAAVAAGGCLFDPREAEQPEAPPPVPWVQPTAPEIALTNIENGMENKYLPHYENSFYELELAMEMDPAEYSSAGVNDNPFVDWSRTQEGDRMGQVFFSMGEETELDVIWGDTEGKWRDEYYEDLDYTLVFTEDAKEIVYSGRVNLYFVQEGGLYHIWKWIDEQDTQDTHTWCYLRHVQKWDYTP